ncbi:carboxypeptidase-like regulatory domain-containing protein [Tunturiibacter lichenicola]|uniref:carboxypeptidase-like regulatory domain-containing protein n=1 Tax=Tunturiibacter lichenicola TaxID=2051959 RepID=UPI003D9B39A6
MGSITSSDNLGSNPSTATSAIPSSVTGQVVNASTGAPVSRALVRLNDRAVLTDHEGKFRFDQNTEASANVLVSKPGYYAGTEFSEPVNLFLSAAQLGSPLEVRLYPEALLTGTLTAPDGTPLPHIAVSAQRNVYDDVGHRWISAGQAQTDSHGNFRIPVQAGDYRLETRYAPQDRTTGEAVLPATVPNENSSNTSRMIRIHSGEEQHFELRPAVSPTHAVTATTQPPSGRGFTRISARSSNGSALSVGPTISGLSGEIKIQLPQGTYTLTARMMGDPEAPEQAETTVTVPDHDISGVVLQFFPIPAIPVELVVDGASTSDSSSPNLQQMGLTLQSEQTDPDRGDSSVRLASRRDQSSVFIVPPGSYRLAARNNGGWYVKSVSYGDSDLLQDELVVAPGAAGTPIRVVVSNEMGGLQGEVKLKGDPSACWIYLIPTNASVQSVYTTRSSASGSYSFAHLPPGSYQVVAFEQRHSADYRDPESIAPFNAQVHFISISAGDKPTLNLDAVPVAEVVP